MRYGLMNNEHIQDQPYPLHLIKGGEHNNLSAFSRFHAVLKQVFSAE